MTVVSKIPYPEIPILLAAARLAPNVLVRATGRGTNVVVVALTVVQACEATESFGNRQTAPLKQGS